MLTSPNRCRVDDTEERTAASSARSHGTQIASPPTARTRATDSAPSATSTIATRAPSLASLWTIARPIPLLPPVTIATLPSCRSAVFLMRRRYLCRPLSLDELVARVAAMSLDGQIGERIAPWVGDDTIETVELRQE